MKATKHQYVFAHPKSPNFWYMRDIPSDVRELLPVSASGKRPSKWKGSLGTAILRDAVRMAHDKASEHNALITRARARNETKHPSPSLSPSDLQRIEDAGGVRGYLRWLDDSARRAMELFDESQSWRDFADSEKSRSESPDPDWLASKTAALDAERHQIERQLARDSAVVKALGNTPDRLSAAGFSHIANTVAANHRDPETITLSGIVDAWKEQARPEAPEQYQYPVRLFEEWNGALPIKQITADHVRAFRDALAKMPPASGGKFDEKTMPEIIRIAERKGLKPLKASTAAKYFRCLKAMFTFAVDEGYLVDSVAATIKARRQKGNFVEANKAKRRTFSPSEMRRLFKAAELARWRDKEENLWFLRLMAYTGARPEELAQLSPHDVVIVGGCRCLNLHDEGDNRIKNPSSVRKVPVHPELLRRGFEEFLKSAHDQPYLFSTLKSDGRGRRYGRMQRRLTTLINEKVSDDPRLVPYSLRHTFRNTMENTDAPEWVIEGIMGHSNPAHRTGRSYGVPQVAKMAEFIAKADPFDESRVAAEVGLDEDDATENAD